MTNQQKKILIVEDDKFLRNIYNTKLIGEGFIVEVASNGEAALVSIRKEKPSLVLLDLVMPKLGGFDVLTTMQEDPKLKDVPVIILSNLGQDSDIARAKKLGAKDYVIKSNTTLESIVQKIQTFRSK